MNKKLFTQIKNEWRSNLWLVTYGAQNEAYKTIY